jgi:hypothetical protein
MINNYEWSDEQQAQLEKQMERVEQQSHQLLVPVTLQLHRLWHGCIMNFVDRHCEDVLLNKKDEYKDIVEELTNKLDQFKRSGSTSLKQYPMEVPTSYRHAISFPWTLEVMNNSSGDMRVTHTRELPIILHREIEQCDRNSTLWKSYEAFIRYRYLPAIERIGEIIDEHGHLMEPVPPDRMREIFKTSGNGYGLRWSIAPRMWFYSYTLAYIDSWKELMSKWDDGIYDDIR